MGRKAKWPPPIVCRQGREYLRVHHNGKPKDYPLGPQGSTAAKARLAQVLAELAAGPAPAPPVAPAGPVTVAEVVIRFLSWAEGHYVEPDGRPKRELACYREAARPLLRLYGDTPGAEFGPRALKAVRTAMASGAWMNDADRAQAARLKKPIGWCRKRVNRQLVRLKSLWRWAESEELVPRGSCHALDTVRGLELGQARESPEVPPVPAAIVDATRVHLNPVVGAAVEVQLLTAARPGEVLSLRPCDLVRSGRIELARGFWVELGADVWAAVLTRHKTAHHGARRILLFGPKAQTVLRPFLERAADACLFSPREAAEQFLAEQGRTANFARARTPGNRYRVDSYERAILAGCRRAFPWPAELLATLPERPHKQSRKAWFASLTEEQRQPLSAWRDQHDWAPNQLRHLAATRLVEQFGWEVARVILGHRGVEMTKVYAVESLTRAMEAIRQVG